MTIVLVVEDNPSVRRMIRSVIGDLAEQIYECADGAEALAAYERHTPDWVLMDIKMTKVDGLVATRAIKTAHPEARIVIVTSYDDDDLRKSAREAGAFDYVLKQHLLALRCLISSDDSSADGAAPRCR